MFSLYVKKLNESNAESFGPWWYVGGTVVWEFAIVGSLFVISFVKQFKEVVQAKYQEASFLHRIEKFLKKFDQIH